MGILSSLNKHDKNAVVTLQFGTFLEYFDLMLFVHMAVILNEIFFPKTDPHTTALLSATAFCSTYIARPIGALIFGRMGDRIGRRQTIMFTMLTMGVSCLIMATLPPYAVIGPIAAVIVTMCRMLQGISSMGEIVGAELYLTETIKPPLQYPCVSSIGVAAVFGSFTALALAAYTTVLGEDKEYWRYCFWFGCGIAFYGSFARARLRETPEFLKMKEIKKRQLALGESAPKLADNGSLYSSTFMLFLIQCAYPLCFYFCYVHCGMILKNSFGYGASQIIQNNLLVVMVQLVSLFFVARLSYWVYPLKILKVKLGLFFIYAVACPYLLHIIVPTAENPNAGTPLQFLLLQCVGASLVLDIVPGMAIFLKHLPVSQRFTSASMAHAASRAATYIATSFGLIYLTQWLGYRGLWLAFIPVGIAFAIGLSHFTRLEKKIGSYPGVVPDNPMEDVVGLSPYEKLEDIEEAMSLKKVTPV